MAQRRQRPSQPLTLSRLTSQVGLGAPLAGLEMRGARLGRCPCGALICKHCKGLVKPADATRHVCDAFLPTEVQQRVRDAEKAAVAAKAAAEKELKMLKSTVWNGKECPACGLLLQKNAGCSVMMCGANAHSSMALAMRQGGCGHEFDWNSMKPLRNGSPGHPANERQIRFRPQPRTPGSTSTHALRNRNPLPVGSVIALHSTAHNRFLRMAGDQVRTTPF